MELVCGIGGGLSSDGRWVQPDGFIGVGSSGGRTWWVNLQRRVFDTVALFVPIMTHVDVTFCPVASPLTRVCAASVNGQVHLLAALHDVATLHSQMIPLSSHDCRFQPDAFCSTKSRLHYFILTITLSKRTIPNLTLFDLVLSPTKVCIQWIHFVPHRTTSSQHEWT